MNKKIEEFLKGICIGILCPFIYQLNSSVLLTSIILCIIYFFLGVLSYFLKRKEICNIEIKLIDKIKYYSFYFIGSIIGVSFIEIVKVIIT